MVLEQWADSAAEMVRGAALPSLPEAYFELKKVIDSDTADREKISQILLREPVLCAQVLKLANCAYFSGGRSVQSVNDAIHILGTDVLVTLALTIYILDAFKGIDPELVDMKKFWKQSIRMAITAGKIAKESVPKNQYSDYYFIVGMLSRIGKLVMYMQCPEVMAAIVVKAEQDGLPKFEIENNILGYSHADVGHELLKHWGLPKNIYEPISHYIYPEKVSKDYKLTAYIVHAAYCLQFAWLHQGQAYKIDLPSRPFRLAFNYLGADEMEMLKYTDAINEEFSQMCKDFNLS
jgi:HD-like signal output (HDOD) protein